MGVVAGWNSTLDCLEELLERDFHIRYTTLQLECSRCEDAPVLQELGHRTSAPVVCSHGHAGHQH